jgi:hypothetical protein
MENIRTSIKRVLVARNINLCQELCGQMRHMPSYQNTTKKPSTPATKSSTHRSMEDDHHGLHHGPPVSQGYNSLFVVVDRLSKATIITPCHKTITVTSQRLVLLNLSVF